MTWELVVKKHQQYTVDGVTYDSPDEMPSEVRQKWDSMADILATMEKVTANMARSSKGTNIRLEYTTEQGNPGRPDSRPQNLESPLAPFPQMSRDTRDLTTRRASMIASLIILPALGLTGLAMFTHVHVIVQYTAGWWIAYALLMLALSVCLGFQRRQIVQRLFPKGDATPNKVLCKFAAALIGVGVLVGESVFGGAPVIAHYLTAHPGELTVTVTRKEARYSRYACSPRLYIREFTFFMRDHLCPSDRAFNKVSVGSKIDLQGEASPFGVEITRYSWYSNR